MSLAGPENELANAARVYMNVVEERYAGRTGWASVSEARSMLQTAIDAAIDAATPSTDLTPLIDSDDFRDAHERAMRDHILNGPDDHICDDLCSEAIIDRLVGKKPLHEYPPSKDE